MEPEIEKDRIESESESSNDGICCTAENRALVDDLETMKPELETDDTIQSQSQRCPETKCVAKWDRYQKTPRRQYQNR